MEEALEFVTKHNCPVILKAAFGGGGRGMRIVNHVDECVEHFERATSEALTAFGNSSMIIESSLFIESPSITNLIDHNHQTMYITNPHHIEVQIMADGHGNTIHL